MNELVKRARMAKVQALIISHLREQLGWLGKESTTKKLMESLPEQFRQVQQKYGLPAGDFPNVNDFRCVPSSVSGTATAAA